MILETPRLLLVPTPLHVVQRRLAEEDFIETLDTPHGPQQVTFPAEWPGDPLPMFPGFAAWLAANPGAEQWGGIVVLRDTWTAVGQAGFKGGPDRDGAVELGYGIGPRYGGRGYATEIVKAFLEFARADDRVASVLAETSATNVASRRVLEKNGFQRAGRREDPEDGPLDLWRAPA